MSYRRHLPFLHPLPADEAVQIIHEEHHKADDDGKVADVLHCRQCPQDDQHHVVGGVGQGKIRAAAEGQVDGGEAGGHGQGAGDDVGGVEEDENEVEAEGHGCGQGRHSPDLRHPQPVHRHLRPVPCKGIAKPGNQRKQGHRAGHAEIGDHLPEVGKAVGDQPVEQTEQDHQSLSDGVALGVEDQRGRADQRCRQGHDVHPVEDQKGDQDQGRGCAPQDQLPSGKINGQFLHTYLQNQKRASAYTSSKT